MVRPLIQPRKGHITVMGLASAKIVKLIPLPEHCGDISLMDFLRSHGITIASSCGGVGTCRKCLVNTTVLSCQLKLKDFILQSSLLVEISYL